MINDFLKTLEIRPLLPTAREYSIKKTSEILYGKQISYYTAFIYDNYGDYSQHLGILVACDENALKQQLWDIYKVVYIKKRSFENFVEWYQNLPRISGQEIENLQEKFNQ